jgi:hypothetical protein
MVLPRLRIVIRSILSGWAALFLITYLLERPLLIVTAPLLGATWFPTARLGLDCTALAATGWTVGRLHRSAPVLGVLAFAATLTFRDFDPLLGLNVPWLIRLAADAVRDSLYLDSLAATAASHILMFGSLIAGGLLSRPAPAPVSILGGTLR